jgi:hypothetical protein
MHLARLLSHVFWFASVPCQGFLFAMLVRRRLHLQFPMFTLYTAWGGLQTATLLTVNYSPLFSGNDYFHAFVTGAIGEAALSFFVIYEVFHYVTSNYPAADDLGATLFRWTTVLLLLLTIVLAWYAPAKGAGHVMAVYYLLQRTISLLQCGLLILLFVFSRVLSLSLRSYAFGIALGFGISASVSLAVFAVRSQIEGTTYNPSTDVLTLISEGRNLVCIFIWIAYLFAEEHKPQAPRPRLPKHDLDNWNQELEGLL